MDSNDLFLLRDHLNEGVRDYHICIRQNNCKDAQRAIWDCTNALK